MLATGGSYSENVEKAAFAFSVSIESSSLQGGDYRAMIKSANQGVWTSVDVLLQSPTPKQADTVSFRHGWQTA
ncbi:hypothetical protein DMH20_11445 [Escherichia coli]|nr:hypothetical protein [Escherichia coli]